MNIFRMEHPKDQISPAVHTDMSLKSVSNSVK